MSKILSDRGARLHYARALRCVASQCIAYPPFPPEKLMIPYMEKSIDRIGREIAKRKKKEPIRRWDGLPENYMRNL